ncbi:hypothetical protein AN958_08527 [Leucoagaricus sp. SymC.cos]|nr:hypothetical protein AN958_08527 [Leucoagaricus sp. SymC.cos]
MSRHPSPGPSHSAPQLPLQLSSAPSRRSRPSHSIGIAAGAEDAKYQTKYKDLKRKVKEIEGDNDKLHFRILQAKLNLQRMKLERAILYERMSSGSSPDERTGLNQASSASALPPRSYSGSHPNRDLRDRPIPIDAEPPPPDYLRQHNNPRPPPPDPNRPMDPPQLVPSPHMSSVQSSSRNSASHDASRHLPPLSHLPPVVQYDSAARTHSLPHASAASPPIHHAHPNSSQSSRPPPPLPQNYPTVPGQQYPESLPPVQRVLHSSPPPSDRDRGSRRLEGNEYLPSHSDPHRHPSQLSPPLHPAEARSSSNRVHAHQRLGPGTYINRDDPMSRQYEHERERGRERDSRGDWERESRVRTDNERDIIHSPRGSHRYPDHPPHSHQQGLPPPPPSRIREDVYYHEGNPYPSVHASRSDTPGSGGSNSGIGPGGGGEQGGGPSRPDSRTQFYEQQQDRTSSRPSYRLRPVNQSNSNNNPNPSSAGEDVEFTGRGHGHDDHGIGVGMGRSQSRDNSAARPSSATSAPSGPNNGSSGTTGSGGGGAGYPPPPPPPLGTAYHPHHHATSSERDRGQTPSRIEPSTSRKRNRNDMEMDVDSDNDAPTLGRGESGSRRTTPAPGPVGYSGEDRERESGLSKRNQREP